MGAARRQVPARGKHHEEGGVGRVIRALDHLCKQHRRNETLRRGAAYFREHRARMNYAELRAAGLPMRSGLVQAACKILVAQRLKLSGMRWGHRAQAILTPRGWDQSDRFDEAWALLTAEYEIDVHVPANVVAFKPPLPAKRRGPRSGQDENYTLTASAD